MLKTLVENAVTQIAIFTDDPGWHGARLKRAFAARGFHSCYVSLTACRLNLDGNGPPISIPGFAESLPDGAFVRGIPGGSLEQVTFYLDILHGLKLLGIPVYNDAHAIERTVDKGMTSFLLRQAGLPTPPAWVLSNREDALALAKREMENGHQIVSKPLFGFKLSKQLIASKKSARFGLPSRKQRDFLFATFRPLRSTIP